MTTWRRIPSSCVHCSQPLEARPSKPSQSMVLEGCEPMEYRHVGGAAECYVRHTARPYTDWLQRRAWEKAKP